MTHMLEAFGQTLVVHSDDPDVLLRVAARLPPFRSATSLDESAVVYHAKRTRSSDRFMLLRGRRLLGADLDSEGAADRLAADLAMTLGHRPHGWTFLHAGVVMLNGALLVFPAASGAGKTTLVSALLDRGAAYGSDEFAVLDDTGRVAPYARPLRVRRGSAHDLVDPSRLGIPVLTEPRPVAAVILTAYDPLAGRVQPPGTRVAPATAALRLLPHCLASRVRPRRTIAAVRALAMSAPVFEVRRGDAAMFASQLVAWTLGSDREVR
jgi:hypothetical protein